MLVGILSTLVVFTAAQSCSFTDDDGHVWDLSSLRKGGTGYESVIERGGPYDVILHLDFCDNLDTRQETCNSEDVDGSMLDQMDRSSCDGSLGEWKDQDIQWSALNNRKGVLLQFSNGALEGISRLIKGHVHLNLYVMCSDYVNYPEFEIYSYVEDDDRTDAEYTIHFYAPFEGCPFYPENRDFLPTDRPQITDCIYEGHDLKFDLNHLTSANGGVGHESIAGLTSYQFEVCSNLEDSCSSQGDQRYGRSMLDMRDPDHPEECQSLGYYDDSRGEPEAWLTIRDETGKAKGISLYFTNGAVDLCEPTEVPEPFVHTRVNILCEAECRSPEPPEISYWVIPTSNGNGLCTFDVTFYSEAVCAGLPHTNEEDTGTAPAPPASPSPLLEHSGSVDRLKYVFIIIGLLIFMAIIAFFICTKCVKKGRYAQMDPASRGVEMRTA